MNTKQLLPLFMSAFLFAGCTMTPAKFSGKGDIASTSGISADKARFKLKADTCDLEKPKTKFVFEDLTAQHFPNGGVRLEGQVVGNSACSLAKPTSDPVCLILLSNPNIPTGSTLFVSTIDYLSTNPAYPGAGSSLVIFVDNGNKKKSAASDTLSIRYNPLSEAPGPYVMYDNFGTLEKGDLKAGNCKDELAPEVEIYRSAE